MYPKLVSTKRTRRTPERPWKSTAAVATTTATIIMTIAKWPPRMASFCRCWSFESSGSVGGQAVAIRPARPGRLDAELEIVAILIC
jgi:hypothetical protein